ncbi:MAG TPA: hypothetical protein VEL76_42055 [Gemmataceae bacterium]|nr:hypothetical protein [Gemmataceae bacterium]
MRIAVLVLAILGGLISGGVGSLWMLEAAATKVAQVAAATTVDEAIRIVRADPLRTPADRNRLLVELDGLRRRNKAYLFLFVGLALSIVGGVLAMMHRGKSGGALLLAAVAGPIIVLGPETVNVLFLPAVVLLSIAGLLALCVRGAAHAPDGALAADL